MILRSVRVESWRALREPLLLEPLDPGLNLIYGPNEVGKSTLLDAICRGLHDRHNASGAAINTRQPWGTTLGPTVTIELELSSGERYRVRKRFVESPLSELHQLIDGRMQKVARGRSADDRLLELLGAAPASRGLSKPEHWGLSQLLWARHGEGEVLVAGDSQQARLREALRITLDTAHGEAIERELRRRYQAVFTDRGRLRARAEVARLAEQLAEAEQLADELQQALDDLEQTAAELAAEEADQGARREARQETRAQLQQRRQQLEDLAEQQQSYEHAAAAAKQAEAAFERLEQLVERVAAVDANASEARGARAEARAAVDSQELAVDAALAARERGLHEVDAAREQLAQAERALRWLRCNRDLEHARRELSQAERREGELLEVERTLAELAGPGRDELEELRRLEGELGAARARLAAASLSLRVEPEGSLSLQAEVDGAPGSARQIQRPLSLSAVSKLVLEIRGVGRIVVEGGARDADELAARLAELEQRWASGRGDELAELEHRARQREGLEAQRAALRRTADQARPDAAALTRRVDALDVQRRALLDRGESLTFCWDSFDRAAAQMEADRAEAAEATTRAEEELEQARATLEAARHALSEARQRHARALATLEAHEAEARRLREEEQPARSDAERRQALEQARREMERAAAARAEAEQAGVVELKRELERLEQRLARQEQLLADGQRRMGSLERDVERAGGEGLYSQLTLAVERRESLRRELAQARVDAEALRLLWQTLREAKQEVLEALLAPIRERVDTGLAALAGPRYRGVELDHQLAPSGVKHEGASCAVGELSHGTRGQLMLLTRLALAELLGESGERQCVIVEDPLTSSDPARQSAALGLLARAAERAQVLVLTCQPGAYASLPARRFDLSELTAAPQG